jgi:hypothetical protein
MVSLKHIWALIGVLALTATATPALADACEGLAPEQARELAKEARQDGNHRLAAQCFRIAGDHMQADREQVRASAEDTPATTQKVAANVESAKAQARRLREAFR